MMRMKNHKLLLPVAVAAAAAAALLSVFMTLSYLTDTEVADNKITIGSVALEIHEGDYEDSQKIAAGGSLPKAPSIENTGKNDELLTRCCGGGVDHFYSLCQLWTCLT